MDEKRSRVRLYYFPIVSTMFFVIVCALMRRVGGYDLRLLTESIAAAYLILLTTWVWLGQSDLARRILCALLGVVGVVGGCRYSLGDEFPRWIEGAIWYVPTACVWSGSLFLAGLGIERSGSQTLDGQTLDGQTLDGQPWAAIGWANVTQGDVFDPNFVCVDDRRRNALSADSRSGLGKRVISNGCLLLVFGRDCIGDSRHHDWCRNVGSSAVGPSFHVRADLTCSACCGNLGCANLWLGFVRHIGSACRYRRDHKRVGCD